MLVDGRFVLEICCALVYVTSLAFKLWWLDIGNSGIDGFLPRQHYLPLGDCLKTSKVYQATKGDQRAVNNLVSDKILIP